MFNAILLFSWSNLYSELFCLLIFRGKKTSASEENNQQQTQLTVITLMGRALTSLGLFRRAAVKKFNFYRIIALDSVDQWHYRCFWLITIRKGQSKQSFKLFLKWEREKWRLQGKLFYESNAHRFIVIFSLVLSLFVCRGRLMMLQQVALNNLKWRLADTAKVKLDNVLEMMCFYPG